VAAGATHPLARQKGFHPAHRQRLFVPRVPQGVSLALPVLHVALSLCPAQFVALRRQTRFGAASMIDTPFEHENVDALGRQLSGEQAGRQPTPHNHDRPAR
jgi:hypothetical protein